MQNVIKYKMCMWLGQCQYDAISQTEWRSIKWGSAIKLTEYQLARANELKSDFHLSRQINWKIALSYAAINSQQHTHSLFKMSGRAHTVRRKYG